MNKLKDEDASGGPILMLMIMSADPMGLPMFLVEVKLFECEGSACKSIETGQVKG